MNEERQGNIANTMLAEGHINTFADRIDLFSTRREKGLSYRQCFGLENPPSNTVVKIDFMESCGYSVIWVDCPDYENVIEGWFKSKQKAVDYAASFGWVVKPFR